MSSRNHSDGFRPLMSFLNFLELTPEDIIMAQEASRSPSSIHETVYENDGDPITLLDQIDDGNRRKMV